MILNIIRNPTVDADGEKNCVATVDENKENTEKGMETKSKRRFKGKRCRPRKKSNANAQQVKAFEDKIKGGCHK